MELDFFKDPRKAEEFWNSNFERPDPDMKMQVVSNTRDEFTTRLFLDAGIPDRATITTAFESVEALSPRGIITGLEDLSGATVILVSRGRDMFSVATPMNMLITTKKGQRVVINGGFEKKNVNLTVLSKQRVGYRHRFSNDVLDPNSPEAEY